MGEYLDNAIQEPLRMNIFLNVKYIKWNVLYYLRIWENDGLKELFVNCTEYQLKV